MLYFTSMKVLLIDNGTTLLKKLEKLIPHHEIVRRFDTFKIGEADGFDLVVLSGGSICPVTGNEEKFSQEINFIQNTKKPLIGICFGCELIVKAFGGELEKLNSREKGIKEVTILDPHFYEVSKIKVYENHQWGITKLPDTFAVLAESDDGVEIIKHKTLPMYGFQFHPENLVNESDGDELFLQIFIQLLAHT